MGLISEYSILRNIKKAQPVEKVPKENKNSDELGGRLCFEKAFRLLALAFQENDLTH